MESDDAGGALLSAFFGTHAFIIPFAGPQEA